jgi:hypothetical protein
MLPNDQPDLNPAKARVRHYADILNPLFWHDDFYRIDTFFELVCAMVRTSGMKDTGWESYYESLSFLRDFKGLGEIELPPEMFPNPAQTKTRLALISYCHLIEMNLPYELLANLLRIRIGMKYATDPFGHLRTPIKSKIDGVKTILKMKPVSPEKKIKLIEEISAKAGMQNVGAALRGTFDPIIRNAVFHSDYVVHNNGIRLLSDIRYSKKLRINTPEVGLEDLVELTAEAFGFHSALDILYKRACTLLTDYRNKFLPYDQTYKGILELTFDGDVLTGFRVYWPNGILSTYHRSLDGQCEACNLHYNTDGSINFFVGEIFRDHSLFSPCVEENRMPNYANVPGSTKRPFWPETIKAYEL